MGNDFTAAISSVTPLGAAIDGVPPKRDRRARARATSPELNRAWRCSACGESTDDVEAHALHLAREVAAFKTLLSRLREAIGPEPIDDEDREYVIEHPINTAQAAEILGTTSRQVQRYAKDGTLLRTFLGNRGFVFDLSEVTVLAEKRELAHLLVR